MKRKIFDKNGPWRSTISLTFRTAFCCCRFPLCSKGDRELHVELWFSFITFCWSQIRLLCLLFHLNGIPWSKSCWFPLLLWQNRNEIQVTIFSHWPRHIISSWGLHCPQVYLCHPWCGHVAPYCYIAWSGSLPITILLIFKYHWLTKKKVYWVTLPFQTRWLILMKLFVKCF